MEKIDDSAIIAHMLPYLIMDDIIISSNGIIIFICGCYIVDKGNITILIFFSMGKYRKYRRNRII